MKTLVYSELSDTQQQLLDAAEKVMDQAYNPYSRFCVGAALLSQSNKIIEGANVENATYGAAICAERSALVRANAEGIRQFKAVATIGRMREESVEDSQLVVSPCGICRQMLFEAAQVSQVDLEVIMSTSDKSQIVITTINELFPYGFGPDHIGIDISAFRN